MSDRTIRTVWGLGVSLAALSCALAIAGPVQAQDVEEEVVVVTGFRESLAEALNIKRASTGAVDAIVAEDIADFPDQNLADSLQRIPGVSITRDNGEGRNITVRGLSGDFTRVRINGMETIAGSDGNRGRGFDFNIFASELFNSLVVRKTASASLDEGSLGAVVDLGTGRPLDFAEGFTLAGNAQVQYNDLNQEWGPRLTGLVAYHSPDGRWGAVGSVAYSNYDTSTAGVTTVRWQKARFRSVEGVNCVANPTNAGCAEVTNAFHARIPRYGQGDLNRERLGATIGLQYRPTDNTEIGLDALYSSFAGEQDAHFLEVLFRGNEGGMDVTDYTIDQFDALPNGASNGTLTSMSVNNAWVRSETFRREWTTDFHQIGLRFEHSFSDDLRIRALVGTSGSATDVAREITFMYDDRDYNGFRYDFTNDESPDLIYGGPDVTNGAIFQLTELRDNPSTIDFGFDTAEFSAEWDIVPGLTLAAGVSHKQFSYEAYAARRDRAVCSAPVIYSACNTAGGVFGPPGTAALSDQFQFIGDASAASNTVWAAPSLNGWIDYWDLFSLPLTVNQGATAGVEETNTGAFAQLSGEGTIGENMRLMFDAGVRYVETEQASSGYNSGVYVTVEREPYEDWLPSANTALWVTDDLVFRASIAKVMTRPALGQLIPSGNVDSFNFVVSYQNPYLDPTRAIALDLAAEWYFAEDAILSFAYFHKDLESRPFNSVRQGTFASTGLPLSTIAPTSPASQTLEGQPSASCNPANGGAGCWEIRSLENGAGAALSGFEVGLQLPFSSLFEDLPPIVRDMGVIANYTYVDSDVAYTYSAGVTLNDRLIGLSNEAYNATIYYEGERFSARISAASRGDYLISGPNITLNDWEVQDESLFVDFSSSFSVNENIELTFEGLNLTNQQNDGFVDTASRRRNWYEQTGSVFMIGARLKN